jgi:hypothetical protein
MTAAGLGLWAWDRSRRHELELWLSRQDAERQRFFAGLERVRQRRGDPYTPWSRQSLDDLRELAALAPARDRLPELRSEAAAALSASDPEPGPLLAGFPAYAAHYSADGARLAVAGWEADPGVRVDLIERATGARQTLAFSPDREWAARAGKPDGARSVKFSPDGQWLVVGTRSGRLARWDLTDPAAGPLVWDAHGADGPDPREVAARFLGFTADGALLSGSLGAARRWSVVDGRPTAPALPGIGLPLDFYPVVNELPVHAPRGRRWAYGLLQVGPWSLVPDRGFAGYKGMAAGPTGWLAAYRPVEEEGVYLRHAHPMANPRPLGAWEDYTPPDHLTFSASGDRLAAVYEHELKLRVWDVASGAVVAERLLDRRAPHAAFRPDRRALIVSGLAGAREYTFPAGVRDTVAVLAEPEVLALAARPDHSEVAVVGQVPGRPPRLYRVSVNPGRPAAVEPGVELRMWRSIFPWADYGPAGPALVGRERPGTAEVRHLPDAWFAAPDVSGLGYGPDGRLWVIGDHRVRVAATPNDAADVWRNDPASEAAGHTLKSVAPGHGFALVGRRDGRVFRVAPGRGLTDSWPAAESAVLGLAVSADGARAVAGGERGEVRLLDLGTGAVIDLPDAHRGGVPAVALGRRLLVTGSADRRVRLWTAAGAPIATLPVGGCVVKVLLSADEASLLVQVQGERAVRRWRLDVLFREWAELGLGDGGPD